MTNEFAPDAPRFPPWYVRGSFVLDRLLGVDRAADIDVVGDVSDSIVWTALGVRKRIDRVGADIGDTFNVDQLCVWPDGSVHDALGKAVTLPPSAIRKLAGVHCGFRDAMRAIKVVAKYPEISLSKRLEQQICTIVGSEEEDLLIQEALEVVLQLIVTDERAYRQARTMLTNLVGPNADCLQYLPDI